MIEKLKSFFNYCSMSKEERDIQKWVKEEFFALLRRNEHIDAVNTLGRALLEMAVDAGLSQHAIALLDKGANPNVHFYKNSPLIDAINTGQRDVAIKLIEKGADVNKRGEVGTPLIVAIEKKERRIAHALLDKKADCTRAKYRNDNDEGTPLELAIENGLSDIALRLLDAGADSDPYKERLEGICYIGGSYASLLFFAIEKGQTDVALKLIEKGADVNRGTCRIIRTEEIYAPGAEYGEMITFSTHTPLGAAFKNWNFKVVNALLDAGARHDFISKKEQKSLGYRITGQFYRAAAGETKAAREKKELDDISKKNLPPSPPAR